MIGNTLVWSLTLGLSDATSSLLQNSLNFSEREVIVTISWCCLWQYRNTHINISKTVHGTMTEIERRYCTQHNSHFTTTISCMFPVKFEVYGCKVSNYILINLKVNMRAFWNVAQWSFVELDRRFRGAYDLHHQGGEWWWRHHAPLKRRPTSTRL